MPHPLARILTQLKREPSRTGSIIITGRQHDNLSTVLGTVAIACSAINAVGGFLITERILKMFKKRS